MEYEYLDLNFIKQITFQPRPKCCIFPVTVNDWFNPTISYVRLFTEAGLNWYNQGHIPTFNMYRKIVCEIAYITENWRMLNEHILGIKLSPKISN